MNNKWTNFIKSKAFIAAFISVFTVALLSVLSVFIFYQLGKAPEISAEGDMPPDDREAGVIIPTVDLDSLSTLEGKEMRGVWIASVININFPSQMGISKEQMASELDDIVQTVKQAGLNAIFFQVRPCADALYPSDIFPWSKYLTGVQGVTPNDGFDPLAYLLQKAHDNGIELHAWINPYRVAMTQQDYEELADTHPAKLHPEYCVQYADGKTYFNPGIPEVRQLVTDGVQELLERYPTLDGISFDDYFYPYPVNGAEFDDAAAYAAYGNGTDLADWRRENINQLIKQTYDVIKQLDPDCSFGVSPFGIWANDGSNTPIQGSNSAGLEAYFSLYCDALAWAKGGYVDYLAPQIYWSFATGVAPFDNIARWWNANLDGTGVKLYIGHAAYKIDDFGAAELPEQVAFARNLLTYHGSIFYGYSDLKSDHLHLKQSLAALYSTPTIYNKVETNPRIGPSINYPSSGSVAESGKVSLLGSSDPALPLTVNGKPVSRTKNGYFGLYEALVTGENTFFAQQGEKTYTHTLLYNVPKNSSTSYKTMEKMEILNPSPSAEIWTSAGDTIDFVCTAPAGSTVTAVCGGIRVELKPTIQPPDESQYMLEIYKGSVQPSRFAGDGESVDLGTLRFIAERDGERAEKVIGLIKQLGPGAPVFAQVTSDYAYLKISPSSSYYDDYLPTTSGMRDYITGREKGYYRLKFGGYVSENDVVVSEGRSLLSNQLVTAALEVNAADPSNNHQNFTDLRFGVLEHVPVNAVVSNGIMTITFYQTDPRFIPIFEIPANPLVDSISGMAGTKDGTVIYTVRLKHPDNYYGFELEYEEGMVIFHLNNPQTLAQGDRPFTGKTFVVDAGHGGTDTGALGPSGGELAQHEADLNLSIAKELEIILTEMGANVVMVRSEDVTVDIYERMDLLNHITPDLAISIHHNSVADSVNSSKARGYLGLYSNDSGILLAKSVSKSVTTALNRMERQTSYQMLAMARNHRFPSTLCEMCFISNPEEFEWSITPGNAKKSAAAVAAGILEFYRAQEAYLEY